MSKNRWFLSCTDAPTNFFIDIERRFTKKGVNSIQEVRLVGAGLAMEKSIGFQPLGANARQLNWKKDNIFLVKSA